MWQNLLKNEQRDIVVPPGHATLKVKSASNKCVYNIQLKRALRRWGIVSASGAYIRKAEHHEVLNVLKTYPKVFCCFLQPTKNGWLVSIEGSILLLRLVPDVDELPKPLTSIVARTLGGVVIFDDFNYRDMQPWHVDDALQMLHEEDVQTTPPTWLKREQRIAYAILAENELKNRIPDTERKIQDLINTEGASLVNLVQRGEQYTVEFRYRGKLRRVSMNEDLMLADSGMCLSGHDKEFSLDTFMSILAYEDDRHYAD